MHSCCDAITDATATTAALEAITIGNLRSETYAEPKHGGLLWLRGYIIAWEGEDDAPLQHTQLLMHTPCL